MRTQQRGFTLLELMVVTAIIGILASIALPSYQSYVYRAKAAEVVTLIDKIHTVMADLQAEEGASLGSQLGVSGVANATGEDAALKFGLQVGDAWGKQRLVPGLNAAELTQFQKRGFVVMVSSGDVNTRLAGQYKVSLNLDYGPNADPKSRADGRQVALATEHIMKASTYRTSISRDGSVGLYFQLTGK